MVKKIFIIFLTFIVLINIPNAVKALSFSEIIQGGNDWLSSSSGGSVISGYSLKTLSDSIYNILLLIGIAAAFIVGMVLGIQFITGSVEQKAKIKDSLIVYIVGCVVIFGAFGIWELVVTVLKNIWF